MKLLLRHIILGVVLAFSVAGYSQNLSLSSINMSPANSVRLKWTWTPSKPSGNYSYTLFQWDNALSIWQSASTKCNDTIRVLNVYPDVAGSNVLKTWMDDPAIGFGKILVTSVSLANFNGNPNGYLKDGNGNYKYDVIMFGSWDSNNHIDINSTSANAVRTFLDAGRGVLFGHDTQCQLFSNFSSLRDKTNLDIDMSNIRMHLFRGSDATKVVNDGFLLKYPHFIPYNVNLTVPYTHTGGQTAKGIVWMNFPVTNGSYTAASQIVNGGTNDFYLTTWNNAAMVQTGHSLTRGVPATTDEKKIIANTLWYLAQFTTDTIVDVCSAPDITPPKAPIVNFSTNCNQINILTSDSGTVYKFYVKATNLVNNKDTVISNQLTVENKTGLRGYFISEDTNPNGVPTVQRDAANNIITPLSISASDNQQVTYTVKKPTYYIHIQAVDYAGNLSAVTTIKASDLQSVKTFHDTICQNNAYKNYGFDIPASELQTAGTVERQYITPSTTSGCDTIVKLKLNVKLQSKTDLIETICKGETYDFHGNLLTEGDIYYDTLQNRFGCDSIVTLYLTVISQDTTEIPAEICDGERYTQNNFNETVSGTYFQYLKNKFGCDSTVILNLTVNPTPQIKITAISDNFCNDDFILLEITTNGDNFRWNTGSSENPLTVTKAGTYSATAFIENCSKTAKYVVEECPCVIWLPNAFTPNGDGLNDSFSPVVYSTLHSFSMHIYDRWGQLVFKTDAYLPWDGTIGGKSAAAGVYSYIISYSCAREPSKTHTKQGSVTLVR